MSLHNVAALGVFTLEEREVASGACLVLVLRLPFFLSLLSRSHGGVVFEKLLRLIFKTEFLFSVFLFLFYAC